jgi:hypothetical protein
LAGVGVADAAPSKDCTLPSNATVMCRPDVPTGPAKPIKLGTLNTVGMCLVSVGIAAKALKMGDEAALTTALAGCAADRFLHDGPEISL